MRKPSKLSKAASGFCNLSLWLEDAVLLVVVM
jgi:hypothetical protein